MEKLLRRKIEDVAGFKKFRSGGAENSMIYSRSILS
jgi:hypothetical protein